jgi:dTDP-4-amino-4,6-dideoxygalactose transaminase
VKVKLLDLTAQHESIKEEIRKAMDGIVSTQQFILGAAVERLEEEVASYCGVQHAVGVASGSDAILLALMALGVGPGDEVVTTPYTFFSTVSSVTRLGAKPVFVDIDPDSYNMNPKETDAALTERTKAVLVVHLFGQAADMDPILQAAGERDIPVIEDACQAIGTRYRERMAGSIGRIGCFSFFPSKNLGGYGDGGMITTDDPGLADEIRMLRVHGSRKAYLHERVGLNSRLDALQAVVLSAKLPHLDCWNEGRRQNAAYYNERLSAFDGLTTPAVARHGECTYNQYVIRARKRNELKAHLLENGIGCQIYYPIPLHLQECFAFLGGGEGDYPEAERAARETLALPVYPELSREEQDIVVDAIGTFITG